MSKAEAVAPLTDAQLSAIEDAACYGIDAASSAFSEPCGRLNVGRLDRHPGAAFVVVPDGQVHNAGWGLWSRWWAWEQTGADEFGTILRVRTRDDRPTEPEDWRPGDIVLSASGDIYTRVDEEEFPWAGGAVSVNVYRSGGLSDADPLRPLTLLVRGGKEVRGVSDALLPDDPADARLRDLAADRYEDLLAAKVRDQVSYLVGTAEGRLKTDPPEQVVLDLTMALVASDTNRESLAAFVSAAAVQIAQEAR